MIHSPIPTMQVRLKGWPNLQDGRSTIETISNQSTWPALRSPQPSDMVFTKTRRPDPFEDKENCEENPWWDVRAMEEMDSEHTWMAFPDGAGFYRMLCVVPNGGNGFDSDMVTIFSDEISEIRLYDRESNDMIWKKVIP